MPVKNIVISIPSALHNRLQDKGFVKGSTPSRLTNEWIKHKLSESISSTAKQELEACREENRRLRSALDEIRLPPCE